MLLLSIEKCIQAGFRPYLVVLFAGTKRTKNSRKYESPPGVLSAQRTWVATFVAA